MIVHVPGLELILEGRPWIAVLVGAFGMTMMSAGAYVMGSEVRAYRSAGHPAETTLAQASLIGDAPRRWVTLTDGIWDCAGREQVERDDLVEAWIFGEVDHTDIPVRDAARRRWLVLRFEGREPCDPRLQRAVTGVLARENDLVMGGYVSEGLKARTGSRSALVLHAGEGSEKARKYFAGFVLFFLLFSWFEVHSVRKWRRHWQISVDAGARTV